MKDILGAFLYDFGLHKSDEGHFGGFPNMIFVFQNTIKDILSFIIKHLSFIN